jgi:peroxiredoxin Q/BCP
MTGIYRITIGLLLLVVMALYLTGAAPAPTTGPSDFTVYPVGKPFRLSEHKGKYVAIHFLLKTECPFCLKHTHDYAERADELPDVVQVFLKPDAPEAIAKWIGDLKLGEDKLPTIYRDENAKLADAFGIPNGFKFHGQTVHYPALVLIGPDGKEVFRYVGKDNSDRYSVDRLKATVEQLKRP